MNSRYDNETPIGGIKGKRARKSTIVDEPLTKRFKQNEIAETNNTHLQYQNMQNNNLPKQLYHTIPAPILTTPNINTQQKLMWDDLPKKFLETDNKGYGKMKYADGTFVDEKIVFSKGIKEVPKKPRGFDYFVRDDDGSALQVFTGQQLNKIKKKNNLPTQSKLKWDDLPGEFFETDNKGEGKIQYADGTDVDEKIVLAGKKIKKVPKKGPRGFDYFVRDDDGSAVQVFTAKNLWDKKYYEKKEKRKLSNTLEQDDELPARPKKKKKTNNTAQQNINNQNALTKNSSKISASIHPVDNSLDDNWKYYPFEDNDLNQLYDASAELKDVLNSSVVPPNNYSNNPHLLFAQPSNKNEDLWQNDDTLMAEDGFSWDPSALSLFDK